MPVKWNEIDWDAERPTLQEAIEAARRLRFHHRPVVGTGCLALLANLQQTHANGGAFLSQFDVDDDAVSAWFASRNRFDELGFFDSLIQSPELRQALPQLFEGPSHHVKSPKFEQIFAGPYVIDGWLAGVLVSGGAYERFRGTSQEARGIAAAAADEVIQGRYEDFVAYRSWEPWSPWFFDIAWDFTASRSTSMAKRVTLLTITDTD